MRIILLGDGMIGKTSLITTYLGRELPKKTIFEEYEIKGNHGKAVVFDSPGQTEYDRLRAKHYSDADAFILVFSVFNDFSFQNILLTWLPQLIEAQVTHIPVLLAGNTDQYKESHKRCITTEDGDQLVKKLKDSLSEVEYRLYSLKNREEITTVFEKACEMAATNIAKLQQKPSLKISELYSSSEKSNPLRFLNSKESEEESVAKIQMKISKQVRKISETDSKKTFTF